MHQVVIDSCLRIAVVGCNSMPVTTVKAHKALKPEIGGPCSCYCLGRQSDDIPRG
jgi:hypothetical protein